MPELHDPTRDSLAEVVRDLVRRNGGPTAVGDVVGAHRLTVTRWMKGDIGIDKLGLLAEKLDEPITVHFGRKEAPPEPQWLEGLGDEIANKVVATLLGGPEIPIALERMREHLARIQPLTHEVPPEEGGVQDPGTGSPPERRVG